MYLDKNKKTASEKQTVNGFERDETAKFTEVGVE